MASEIHPGHDNLHSRLSQSRLGLWMWGSVLHSLRPCRSRCRFHLLLWLTSAAGCLTELLLNHVYLNGRWCALLLSASSPCATASKPQQTFYTLIHLGTENATARNTWHFHTVSLVRGENTWKGRSLRERGRDSYTTVYFLICATCLWLSW